MIKEKREREWIKPIKLFLISNYFNSYTHTHTYIKYYNYVGDNNSVVMWPSPQSFNGHFSLFVLEFELIHKKKILLHHVNIKISDV